MHLAMSEGRRYTSNEKQTKIPKIFTQKPTTIKGTFCIQKVQNKRERNRERERERESLCLRERGRQCP